jgi:hypothetical protein
MVLLGLVGSVAGGRWKGELSSEQVRTRESEVTPAAGGAPCRSHREDVCRQQIRLLSSAHPGIQGFLASKQMSNEFL